MIRRLMILFLILFACLIAGSVSANTTDGGGILPVISDGASAIGVVDCTQSIQIDIVHALNVHGGTVCNCYDNLFAGYWHDEHNESTGTLTCVFTSTDHSETGVTVLKCPFEVDIAI